MTKLLKFFLAGFSDGRRVTNVTLSKSKDQLDGPLRGVNFTHHDGTIRMNSRITAT